MWCPVCKTHTRQVPPRVSVRAIIFALGRFGIVGPAEAKSLEKRWAKHRKENGLDRNGKLLEALSKSSAAHGPDRHSHDPTLLSHPTSLVPHPSVKIEKAYRWMKDLSSAPTSAGRDRPRGVREIGRRNRRCLTASGMLTSWGSW